NFFLIIHLFKDEYMDELGLLYGDIPSINNDSLLRSESEDNIEDFPDEIVETEESDKYDEYDKLERSKEIIETEQIIEAPMESAEVIDIIVEDVIVDEPSREIPVQCLDISIEDIIEPDEN
ncbi:hypothetical protein, partial [uncultured Clostridium sp.]|uniref:hypothetical protein n=1 Tax=uncultured Clostridium sp. TaxID=59620 RepID=UPI0026107DEC